MGVAVRTCLFSFAAFLLASLAMLSPVPSRADAAAVGPPSVSILSPTDGAVIPLNTVITFSGIGADSDGTALVRGQLQWTSSQNGFLGTGPGFMRNSSTLNLGSHRIRLLATGNNNMQSSTQVTIWIGPTPTATPTSTPTPTATNTPTSTPTPLPTDTPTPTNTPQPPTSSPTSTATATSVPTLAATGTATASATSTPAGVPSATRTPGRLCPDFDGDGRVGWRDLWRIASAIEHHNKDPKFDVNGDGRVGWPDLWATLRRLGHRCDGAKPSPPPRHGPDGSPKPQ